MKWLYPLPDWPVVFLNCPFLLLFSCPKRDNSTTMMYINCLFFQDRHIEIVNYPFKKLERVD